MVKELLKKLKIKTSNEALFIQAITHSSYTNENPTFDNNERLEFLGDAVIDLLMSNYLFDKDYKDEGELSKRRAQAVCEEALAIYAKHLDLSSYLKIGKGLELDNSRHSDAINADAFEALFAALYLDQGYKKTEELFYKLVVPFIDETKDIKDYKSVLQQIYQKNKKNVFYELIEESGPSHNKTFKIAVKSGKQILGIGTAGSKKDAEQIAAKEALKVIDKG